VLVLFENIAALYGDFIGAATSRPASQDQGQRK
jgi:hypothetical protein